MEITIQERLGQRVKALRVKKGWSQEKLAELTGFHRTYIGMVERGERNISLQNIFSLSKQFGLSLEELFKDL
ncbi:helix-turn-helix domain-containing protein [Salinimicrobium xinjiangense]|uniref:helix-turn-helix domain-containing protein n=1 Tax=Salinimicrobium xinjiangense TaxID=438596 RepID=UPI00048AD2FB|nr:helix-turn-helix transcriptional regulator [Salinimicrobium xinjiangense]